MKINLRKQTHFFIVLFVLCVFLASPQIAQASGNQDHPFPSLKSFTDQVRHSGPGPQGIWAEGLFAFEVKTDCWGCVPNQRNLAS